MQLTTDSSTPTMCWLAWQWDSWIHELNNIQFKCWTQHIFDSIWFWLSFLVAAKRLYKRVCPSVLQHFVQKRENGYTAPAQPPRLMLGSVSSLVLLSLIQSFAFKGCSWRPLPAYPRCAEWHTNGIVEFGMSRASVWSALLYSAAQINRFTPFFALLCGSWIDQVQI